MIDDQAFIQAIAADPANDHARLVYSDWLEEHGKLPAAQYLRTELELARLPPDATDAPRLRSQLWQAWAGVDPHWLLTFTQPRLLRANPTPYPCAWKNFGLGTLRDRNGTYDTWPYDSVPALALDELRGEFQYLQPERSLARRDFPEILAAHRQDFERLLADAARQEVHLPETFVKFMGNPAMHHTFRSVTDCFFAWPDEYSPIRATPANEGMHVHFYCDSLSCLLWDLFVHPNGSHCVIARSLDFFEPEPPEADDGQSPYTGPRAWFVAPSFEAFVYRVWLENQIWYLEHADYLRHQGEAPPPLTPAIQAYIDHYRNRQPQG